jgi:hypothetical protein
MMAQMDFAGQVPLAWQRKARDFIAKRLSAEQIAEDFFGWFQRLILKRI